jgi:WASH complex subunit strumpellin
MLNDSFQKLKKFAVDGNLLEDYVLDNIKELLECLRHSNVTIRWLMLHINTKNLTLKEIV